MQKEQKVGFYDGGLVNHPRQMDSKVMTCLSMKNNANVVTSVNKPSVSGDGFYKRNNYPKHVIHTKGGI